MTQRNRITLPAGILRVYSALLILLGLALAAGGGYLVSLGGSPYYLLSGLALVASAILLWRQRAEGALLYGLTFCATLAWAIWEAGYDAWALLPRLLTLALLGLVLLIPAVRRQLEWRSTFWSSAKTGGVLVGALLLGMALRAFTPPAIPLDPMYQTGTTVAPAAKAPPASAPAHDWPYYGNDAGGTRFSSAAQITPQNISKLREAWRYHIPSSGSSLSATPLKIGQSLYLCTNANSVVALDAETGQERWAFRPPVEDRVHRCRGVAYYKVPGSQNVCAERIITASIGTRLIALDAHTGQRCADFGTDGEVSLLTGMGEVPVEYYYVSSAPMLIRGKVVVGGWVIDNQHWLEAPSGVIRAFDAVTGKLSWAWDMGRPEHSLEPPPGETYTPSTPNSWAPMSADETLGLVYAPMGNASGADFFGGTRRPIDDQYASSIVALDAETGKPRWTFQTVKHDLWDYDVAPQPTLVDIPSNGGTVRALVQGTKRGEVFVLDRESGKPLFPVEDRPAPQAGKVPEEYLSPTQPYSVGMPSFRGADLVEGDMWGATPLDQLWCRVKFREARYEGLFTPPGLTPSIQYPSVAGGMQWSGVAIDLNRNILLVNTSYLPNYVRLVEREEAIELGLVQYDPNKQKVLGAPPKGRITAATVWRWVQNGTPYGVLQPPFWSPLEMPCNRPPYGRLSAVDLTTGKLIWTQPFGTARSLGPLGTSSHLPLTTGAPTIGGGVVTGSGVFFIAAGMDQRLRAFDTSTGKLLWETELPGGGRATPMTYVSADTGRQFVVIAAGRDDSAFVPTNDTNIVAYALPKS